jgi:transposase
VSVKSQGREAISVISREASSIRQEKENGMPVARIARRYGISRQSVYNVVNGVAGGARVRPPRPSLLDAFKPYLRARLARFDLPSTVLWREIQRQGYGGGISILKEFVGGVKTDFVRGVIERFETLPGAQAQLDWGECGVIVEGGVARRLYLFVFVLGFSRVTFARITTSMRQPELLSCTREAFEAVGVPKELLVDNMKTALDRHLVGEEVRFNAGFFGFCEHYGALPVAYPPYWPRVKGKVGALSSVQLLAQRRLGGLSVELVSEPSKGRSRFISGSSTIR